VRNVNLTDNDAARVLSRQAAIPYGRGRGIIKGQGIGKVFVEIIAIHEGSLGQGFQAVETVYFPSLVLGVLKGGQQHCRKNCDYRNYDQQLYQREPQRVTPFNRRRLRSPSCLLEHRPFHATPLSLYYQVNFKTAEFKVGTALRAVRFEAARCGERALPSAF
jgi:hypothetical protein